MMEDKNYIVCNCKNVDILTIKKAMLEGATTVEEIKEKTGAGTGCGGCIPEIENILHIICKCKNVSYDEIFQAVKDGANTVEEVGEATGAGTCCGTCKPNIQNIGDF